MTKHRCELCDPARWERWGRDVWCPNYQRENLEAMLEEPEDPESKTVLALVAKEEREAREKKHGPH